MTPDNQVVLTIDVDWAPDFMIDATAALLTDREVRATWFVTHRSPAIERLRERPDLFELGVHPNFLAGSSHGTTPEAVLAHCRELVPDAVSVRTHSLAQSTPLLDAMAAAGLRIECSLYTERLGNPPLFEQWTPGGTLVRVPFVWEDDLEARRPDPLWGLARLARAGAGLQVMDFHPVHVYLNSGTPAGYTRLKQSGRPVIDLCAEDCEGLVGDDAGAGSTFVEAADHLAAAGGGRTIRQLVERTTA